MFMHPIGGNEPCKAGFLSFRCNTILFRPQQLSTLLLNELLALKLDNCPYSPSEYVMSLWLHVIEFVTFVCCAAVVVCPIQWRWMGAFVPVNVSHERSHWVSGQ